MVRNSKMILFYLCMVWSLVPILTQDLPVVTTPLGNVQGIYEKTYKGKEYAAFYSVPYAKPPVDNLRFEEPQPIEPWTETWIANNSQIYCSQLEHVYKPMEGLYRGSEDCLYLTLYIPRQSSIKSHSGSQDLLDVFVYIHGGGFMFGDALAAGPKFIMDRDVIYVSINYRVGLLGFLSTEDEVLPGNVGMKDQVLALKWVKDNIQNFGGNPESITISGMSAGGASVHFHYLSPLSKGLFHRGISQSGSALAPWALQKEALMKAKFIGSSVGCNQQNNKELVDCLKTIPAKELVEATKLLRPWMFNPFSPFSLVVETKGDNRFLPEHPYILLRKGKIQDIPWLKSITAQEGLYPGADLLKKDTFLPELNKRWLELAPHILHYNHTVLQEEREFVSTIIRRTYMKEKSLTKDNFKKLIDLYSDRLFSVSGEKATLLHAKANKSPVYFYYFNFIREKLESLTTFFTNKDQHEGVCHGDDYMFFFSVPRRTSQKLSKTDKQMQDLFFDIWMTFARTGRVPKRRDLDWTPVPSDGKTLMQLHINSPFDTFMENAKEIERYREMWGQLPFREDEKLFGSLSKDEL